MPLNLSLGSDCGATCIEVYGRCVEKHTTMQHILYRMTSDGEMSQKNETQHFRDISTDETEITQ